MVGEVLHHEGRRLAPIRSEAIYEYQFLKLAQRRVRKSYGCSSYPMDTTTPHRANALPMDHCPEHIQLLALAEGTLTESEAAELTRHISRCRSCDAQLGAIEEQSDELLQALATIPANDDDEKTFRELQAKLLASPEEFGTLAGTVSHAFIPRDLPADYSLPMDLGSYKLIEQIGVGAHGAVFRARHRRLEKTVAIKLLLNVAQSAVDEFLNEMRVIGKLCHPNIIEATDAGEHEGVYFLVMEYVPGLDVSSVLRHHGPLSSADACEMARQTALGLSAAHDKALVHRDVKTSNLLFTSSGQIKLLDLGLATISSRHADLNIDRSGPRGTADYMAPEQWREASSVDDRADIYSLGCTLYKLLTGAPPFRPLPEGVATLEQAHLNHNAPPLPAVSGGIPSGLEAFLHRMLAKQPQDRPSSVEVVAQLTKYAVGSDLWGLARQVMPHTTPRPPAPTLHPPASRHWSRRTWALTAVLGGLGMLAWGVRNRPGPSSEIRSDTWRPLTPVGPRLIRIAEAVREDAQPTLQMDGSPQIDSGVEQPVLLHLGRPLTGAFRIRACLRRDDWSQPAGIFFRLRAHEDGTHEFQTIEVVREMGECIVSWKSYPASTRTPAVGLAETSISATTEDDIELDVSVGLSGFPKVALNGTTLPQSRWTISKEGRERTTFHARQLTSTYAGHIGVLHPGGTTLVTAAELMYL